LSFKPNTRRVYTSFATAAEHARGWGYQTGRKHRIQRYREWWVVRRTTKRTGPFPPAVPVYIGEVRLVIDIGPRSGASVASPPKGSPEPLGVPVPGES
jgi:hypothetical protein